MEINGKKLFLVTGSLEQRGVESREKKPQMRIVWASGFTAAREAFIEAVDRFGDYIVSDVVAEEAIVGE